MNDDIFLCSKNRLKTILIYLDVHTDLKNPYISIYLEQLQNYVVSVDMRSLLDWLGYNIKDNFLKITTIQEWVDSEEYPTSAIIDQKICTNACCLHFRPLSFTKTWGVCPDISF